MVPRPEVQTKAKVTAVGSEKEEGGLEGVDHVNGAVDGLAHLIRPDFVAHAERLRLRDFAGFVGGAFGCAQY